MLCFLGKVYYNLYVNVKRLVFRYKKKGAVHMRNLSKSELNTLVEASIKGDKDSFSILYEHTFHAQYYRSLSILKDSRLAEEAAQSAYTKALEKIPTLSAPEGFLSWLDSITYHCCMDILRKNKRCSVVDTCDEEFVKRIEEQKEKTTPLDMVLDNEKKAILMDTLDTLSDIHRSVIIMRYFEDLSLKDIAVHMDCSTGTVKSRLHYAHKELRNKLKEQGYTGVNSAIGIATLLSDACAPKKSEGAKKSKLFPAMSKVVCGGLLSCALFAGVLYAMTPSFSKVEVRNAAVWSSASKDIVVKTDGSTPDKVVLYRQNKKWKEAAGGGEHVFKIFENGSYKVCLMKNGVKTDQRQVTVDHIDKAPPEIVDYRRSNLVLQVTVSDSCSGVDFSKAKAVDSSGNRVDLIRVSEKDKTIVLPYTGEILDLTLYDKAGNINVYKIEDSGAAYYLRHK